jgi:hypothetical protein
MNKKLAWVILVAVMAPALWLGSGGKPGWADANQGFGQKVAGAWLLVVDVGYEAQGLINFNADGCIIQNGQLRPVGDSLGRYNSTGHGSWVRTGPNQIEGVVLLQIQDNNGNLVMYERAKVAAVLNKSATAMEGSGIIHLIELDYDPLDPNAPGIEIPATVSLRRIR